LLAPALIALVEAYTAFLGPPTPAGFASPLLHMAFGKEVGGELVQTAIKFEEFPRLPADIVQVGDSAGLMAVQPRVIRERLGVDYLNASLFMTLQWEGFETMAKQQLRTHPHAHTLVYFINIGLLMRPAEDGIGARVRFYYDSPSATLLSAWPSLRYRPQILRTAYLAEQTADPLRMRSLTTRLRETGGWMTRKGRRPQVVRPCAFDVSRLNENLARIDAMRVIAARHGRRFALVVGPIYCEPDASTHTIEAAFAAYQRTHPEVFLPMGPGITFVEPSMLNDAVHMTEEGSTVYSAMLADALRRTGLADAPQ
jgi:hypothetical protein